MCSPMMGIGLAMSGLQMAAGASAQQSAADAYNAQAAAAHRDAAIAYQNKVGDLQRKYVYDERAVQQKGYAATLKGRAALATGVASAGSAGIAPGSVTLEQLMNDERQVTAENESRINTQRDDLKDQFIGNTISAQYEAMGRQNAIPFKSGPNYTALALNAGSTGLNALNQGGFFTGWGMNSPFNIAMPTS
jgi:hypothetical protein